jgi:hypothetical protein
MRTEDVVSPISLTPTELEQFRKAWVLYLEREGITTDRQPMVTDVADYCFAMDIAFSYPHTSLTPFEYDEPSATSPQEDKAERKKPASPILTPEQDALAKEPWTPEDRRGFEQWCSQQVRRYPDMYTPREQVNWIRRRRGVPLLPPDPPREPMIWIKGSYRGMKGIHDYQQERRANDGFKRQGTFSTA